jgi:hypothetical protein
LIRRTPGFARLRPWPGFWAAVGIIGFSGVLSLGLWSYFEPGFFHDDAIYWLLSRAVLKRQYFLPGDPSGAMPSYLPGYPLFLAVTTWWGSFPAAKAVSWALTWASLIPAWALFRRRLAERPALLALAWLAVQPALLRYSATCLSEPLFIFLATLAFWLYDRQRLRPLRGADIGLALLVGYSCWVRTSGLLLAAAMIGDAVLTKQYRRAVLLAAAAAVFSGAFVAWRGARSDAEGPFVQVWHFSVQGDPQTAWRIFLRNLAAYTDFIPFVVFFPWLKWLLESLNLSWALVAVRVGVVAVLAAGWVKALRGPARPLALFLPLYMGLILAWLRPDVRYLLPALFPLLFLAVLFLQERPAWLKATAIPAIGLALAFNLWDARAALQGPVYRVPVPVYRWLDQTLPPGAVTASVFPHTTYFYTGRPGTSFPLTYDPEEFLLNLLHRGATHIVIDQTGKPHDLPDSNQVGSIARMMITQPGRYEKVDGNGPVFLFRIRADAGTFRRAYEHYVRGIEAAEAEDPKSARAFYLKALDLQPDMTAADDRLFQAAFRAGNLAAAQRHLRAALNKWPDAPLLRYHSYLLRRALKDPGAAEDLAAAQAGARRYGHWFLARQLEQPAAPYERPEKP